MSNLQNTKKFVLGLSFAMAGLVVATSVAVASPVPASVKLTDIKASGMLFQVSKNLNLFAAATVASQSGFPPAPNTIYFVRGQAFQKKKDQGPFALIDIDSKTIDANLGQQFMLGTTSLDHCELDLLTDLGATTIPLGSTFAMYDMGSFSIRGQLTIPLQEASHPTVVIGQFRCSMPVEGDNATLTDLRNVTGGRIDIVTP